MREQCIPGSFFLHRKKLAGNEANIPEERRHTYAVQCGPAYIAIYIYSKATVQSPDGHYT